MQEYFSQNPSGWVLRDEPESMLLKVKGHDLDVLTHNKLGEGQILEMAEDG